MRMMLAFVAGLKAADAHEARTRGVASLCLKAADAHDARFRVSWRGSRQLMLMMLGLVGWLHFARRLLMRMMLAFVAGLKAADAHDARSRGVASLCPKAADAHDARFRGGAQGS